MNSPNRTNVSTGHSVVDASLSQVNAVPLSTTVGEGALRLNPEQLAKLRSELDIVQENMTILNEMLTELVPGQEHPSDLELLSVSYLNIYYNTRWLRPLMRFSDSIPRWGALHPI